MTIVSNIARRAGILTDEKRDLPLSLDEYASWFTFNGLAYPLTGYSETMREGQETIASNFHGYVHSAYKQNGIVFACILARMGLFSEARFQYRRLQSGRPGELFGDQNLSILENPWPGGSTGELLSRAEQDASLAGNFFARKLPGNTLRRMRPDWVSIVMGSNEDPEDAACASDTQVLGYLYHPGGAGKGKDPIPLLRDQVVHYAPTPDPEAHFRGMSWLTPIVQEIMGDKAATQHKLKFFENGATPNMVVKMAPEINREAFDEWVSIFKAGHEGAANAYKTLFLGGGADLTVVGKDFQQMEFKVTQGAGETRIAAAAGVPPIVIGLSEGLAAATYSNYGQARRAFSDGTMRHLWRKMVAAFSTIVTVPPGAELWYDDRDIAFLQEDQKDEAAILGMNAVTITTLVNAGFDPALAIQAVVAGDLQRLKHTGLVSVQLQEPGATPPGTSPAVNGTNSDRTAALEALRVLANT